MSNLIGGFISIFFFIYMPDTGDTESLDSRPAKSGERCERRSGKYFYSSEIFGKNNNKLKIYFLISLTPSTNRGYFHQELDRTIYELLFDNGTGF